MPWRSRSRSARPVCRRRFLPKPWSDPRLPAVTAGLFRQLPQLPITAGYWERVGLLRADVIAQGRKARLADALIAQSCLDHSATLITRDGDFRNFSRVRDLQLLLDKR